MEINITDGNNDEIAMTFTTRGLAVKIPLSRSDVTRIEELIKFARNNFWRGKG